MVRAIHMLSVQWQTDILTNLRMIQVCDKWSLEDFCDMTERDMEVLVESFATFVVPSYEQVQLREDPDVWRFDNSFGFAV